MPRMTKAKKGFRAELAQACLSQKELAAFLGKDPVTVNRWCNAREDALLVPQYARAFVNAYARLTETERVELSKAFGLPPALGPMPAPAAPPVE